MKRLAFLLPVALLIAGFAAGCGGGSDDSDSGSSDAAAKTAFITKADDLCATSNKQIQVAVTKELGNKKPTKAIIISITRDSIVPGLEAQLKQLKALEPPSGDNAELDTFLSAFSDDIQNIKKNPSSAVSGNPMESSTNAAKNYGFDNCGSFGTA